MNDPVRPSAESEERVLKISTQAWFRVKLEASSVLALPPECILLHRMLGKVPAYLGYGKCKAPLHFTIHQQLPDGIPSPSVAVGGKSIWKTSQGSCLLPPKNLPLRLLLGVQHPTTCTFGNDSSFTVWPGVRGAGSDAKGNYLAVLTFAWAYILSALWLEILQFHKLSSSEDNCLQFLDSKAPWLGEKVASGLECVDVNLGGVKDDAARWWMAVLAPKKGWSATIRRGGHTYCSPWSVQVDSTKVFVLQTRPSNTNLHDDEFPPPSSSKALQFLSDFCSAYNIHDQGLAALSAALYLPFHVRGPAYLPRPVPYVRPDSSRDFRRSSHSSSVTSQFAIDSVKSALPYYLTISCNGWGIRSLLHSVFFNPTSCNLVAPWLEPAFNIINPLLESSDHLLLAKMMGVKQPQLGALWLGAFLTGAAVPTLQAIRAGMCATDLSASAWTSTTQHFFTIVPSEREDIGNNENGNEEDEPTIRRSNECRLLFLTGSEEHKRVPICSWKPFGSIPLCETDPVVRAHASCLGHNLQYMNWSWDLEDQMEFKDEGFDPASRIKPFKKSLSSPVQSSPRIPQALMSSEHSELATRSIFGWLRPTGHPPSERGIFAHSWFDIEDSEEEASGEGSPESAQKRICDPPISVRDWLDTIDAAGVQEPHFH